MLSTSTLVLLVTALACVCAQDVTEEGRIYKKSKIKPLLSNIHDGQGKKMNENISYGGKCVILFAAVHVLYECCVCFPLFVF